MTNLNGLFYIVTKKILHSLSRLSGLVCCLLLYSLTAAQTNITQPCARSIVGLGQDSITWSATPCANFEGYIIYASDDTNSPLLPIDTINNVAQLGYIYPNTGEIPRYYRIAMLCGGSIAVSSIIVSNQRPITPNIRSVSIVNNVPILSWYQSPSPEVIGYQIYKENPYGSGNFFPYPNNQIQTGLSFTDVNSPDLLVRYALVAKSPCSEGLLGDGGPVDYSTGPHTSIFLEADIDPCTRVVSMNWNAYENWAEGVTAYEIWMGINGATPTVVGTTTNTSFSFMGAQDNDVLNFWVRALEKNQSNSALSNRINMSAAVNREMDFLQLTGISVEPTSQGLEISWRWDLDTDFANAVLQRKAETGVWENRLNISSQSTLDNDFLDTEVNTSENRYFYRLIATDACGNKDTSNVGASILLQGEAQDGFINHLYWTPLYFEYGTTHYYDFYKLIGGVENRIDNLSPTDSLYDDKANIRIEAEANSCYYLMAESRLQFPNGTVKFMFSRSNTVCLEQQAVLFFPNAFAPDGKNDRFRPLVAYGQTLQSYNLEIYNRYGQLLFKTADANAYWDGIFQGEAMPQGVYAYIARYTLADGRNEIQKGTVMLLR